MTDDAHRAILRQIVGDTRVAMPGGPVPESGGDGRFALRLEAARAVRDDFGLTGIVETCALLRPRLEDLEAEVTPDRLSMLLRGGAGRLGLAVYSPELAMALLEWRLLGMLAAEVPAPRRLTATDAAILADLTDPLLARFGAAMAAKPGGDWAEGYSQGGLVHDPRHLPLILAQGGYHGFRLTLKLGDGVRGGDLFFALPESHAPAAATSHTEEGAPWPDALRGGVLGAELGLNAVLWRMRLSAADIGRLRPGDLLPIPLAALTSVRLEGPGRVVVAEGRLGQSNGDRAVKISGGEDDPPGLAGPSMAAPMLGGMADPIGEDVTLAMDTADFPVETADFPAMGEFDAGADFDPDAAFAPQTSDFDFDFPALSDS
ncbi:FliM/FliN family flagellar motor switch protein [Rhodovulum euryhalinum]|uniref:Type III flagellar switch regulator (C-ring) FliN n=1 Tax=Rhodovulum euryhalinum TaxID=35805 RepID=A0A4R2K9X8_9RHOB|nr:FliM/FliN family flagellar motor C-terminal domain-containing protein [Rhodovulum euryhalinum]TCO68787.1 type III flagellar switch regulator (C-ring) FliN [Rhodovulum euryhalinum]